VKYLISSSLVISGNDRSCSSCSSENIFSDTSHPSARLVQTGSERCGIDHQLTNQAFRLDISAGRSYIRPKLRQCYRDPEYPLLGEDGLFEVRVLTVDPSWRGTAAASLLMHAALRWVVAHGGRRIVALGRTEILRLYLAAGLSKMECSVRSGAVTFELMHGEVDDLVERSLREHGPTLRRLESRLRWKLDVPFLPGPDACAHGGASIRSNRCQTQSCPASRPKPRA
jgi:GNAT superfamily N-acetyltransferase